MLIPTTCSMPLAFAILYNVQAHAGQLNINDTNNIRESTNVVANRLGNKMQSSMDKLVNDSSGKLFNRMLAAASFFRTDLNKTTLGKPGHSAIPALTGSRSLSLLPIACPSRSYKSFGSGLCDRQSVECAAKLRWSNIQGSMPCIVVCKVSEGGWQGTRNVRVLAGEEKSDGQQDRDKVLRLNKESQSGRKTISGRRIIRQREGKEMDEFLTSGSFFESAKAFLRAITLGGFGDIDEVGPGQLVVMDEDIPSQRLVKGQLYEVVRIYYQRRGTLSKQNSIEVAKVGAPNPAALKKGEVWDKWCELYSEEYHSQPVRCELDNIKLRPVGNEVSEALSIALPVALIPIGTFVIYGALTSGGQWCLLGPLLGHC